MIQSRETKVVLASPLNAVTTGRLQKVARVDMVEEGSFACAGRSKISDRVRYECGLIAAE